MKHTYCYHGAFLPEYMSAVLISLLTMWIGVSALRVDRFPLKENPHLIPSIVMYVAVVLLLVGLTYYHRWKHSALLIKDDGIERAQEAVRASCEARAHRRRLQGVRRLTRSNRWNR